MKRVDRSAGHTHGHHMNHSNKTSCLFSLTFFLPPAGKRKFVWWTPQKDSQNIWRGTSSQTQVLCLNRVSHLFWFNCTPISILHTHLFLLGVVHSTAYATRPNRIICFAWLKPESVSFLFQVTQTPYEFSVKPNRFFFFNVCWSECGLLYSYIRQASSSTLILIWLNCPDQHSDLFIITLLEKDVFVVVSF